MKSNRNATRVVFLAVLSAAAILVSSCSAKSATDRVKFEPYNAKALMTARGAGKPVVVYATADWCGYCQRLDAGALSETSVKTALDSFARLEIDNTSRDPRTGAVLIDMNVEGLPTLIFKDKDGTEVARLVGDQPAEAIIAAAKKASGE